MFKKLVRKIKLTIAESKWKYCVLMSSKLYNMYESTTDEEDRAYYWSKVNELYNKGKEMESLMRELNKEGV